MAFLYFDKNKIFFINIFSQIFIIKFYFMRNWPIIYSKKFKKGDIIQNSEKFFKEFIGNVLLKKKFVFNEVEIDPEYFFEIIFYKLFEYISKHLYFQLKFYVGIQNY